MNNIKLIKKGDYNDLVSDWQSFLIDQKLYFGRVDNDFGELTYRATEAFQRRHRIKPYDGIVGKKTWGKAIALGFDIELEHEEDYYPPKPDFSPLSSSRRIQMFGEFEYEHTPTKRNPEKITITDNWAKENIVMVELPALKEATNGRYTRMRWHKKAKHQLVGFFKEIQKEGYHHDILSYAGAFYPRFIRGSRTSLSNHSWGTAFDINVAQNGLNRQPAPIGEKGCVMNLVPIANKWGFYWGGHFRRKDGMHFEIAKIIDEK